MPVNMTVRKPVEIEVAAIRCVLAVRYDEEDMPNDYPHRHGDTWDVTIDVETGQIHAWPAGIKPRELSMKVVDEGSYYLLDSSGRELGKRERNYVPDCIPGSYGDYIEFKIDASGRITNWKFDVGEAVENFFPADGD